MDQAKRQAEEIEEARIAGEEELARCAARDEPAAEPVVEPVPADSEVEEAEDE